MERNASRQAKRQWISEMADLLKAHGDGLKEYDGKLVRQLVEQVMVHEQRIAVRFKSGIEGEVE